MHGPRERRLRIRGVSYFKGWKAGRCSCRDGRTVGENNCKLGWKELK